MTRQHAELIYRMYRHAGNLSWRLWDGAGHWTERYHAYWLKRWLAVPDSIVAKMGIA